MKTSYKISINNILIIAYMFCFLIVENGTLISTFSKLFFATLIIINIKRIKKLVNGFTIWYIIFTLFVVMSVNWAIYKEYAFQSSLTVIYTSICSLALPLFLIKNQKNLYFFYYMIIVLPIIYFVYYLIFYDVQNIFNLRIGATSQIYNNIGLYAAYSFAMIKIYFSNKKKNSVSYNFFLIIDIFLILISQSRKSYIYILIIIVLSLLFASNNMVKTLLRLFLLSFFVCIIYLSFRNGLAGESMKELILSLEGTGTDSSVIGRLNQFDIAVSLFKNNYLLGSGIGSIEYVCRFIHGQIAPIVDNDYLDLIADLGIIGLTIYYSFFWYLTSVFLRFKKKWDETNLSFFVLLILLIIQGFLIRGYFNNYYIPLLLYLIYLNSKELKKRVAVENDEK